MEPTSLYEYDIESVLKTLLQSDLTFTFNNRKTKQGKFVLYKIHHHALVFMLSDNPDSVTLSSYRVPYPFDVDFDQDGRILKFNYCLSALFGGGSPNISLAAQYAQQRRPSRYYNNTLTINIE